jgi:hypothetical protein
MHTSPRSLSQERFKGWPAWVLRQGPLTLCVVPDVGGRLMGMAYGGQELCFTHPALEGKTFDGDMRQWPALCGEWEVPLWGGGKTWVGPESAWPAGAPHRDLDSLAWQVRETWCDAQSMGIDVQSPVCGISGLQITRRLTLHAHAEGGASQWTIDHSLSNTGSTPVRCGIWDVLMLLRPARARVPLSSPITGPALAALPGKKSLAALRAQGTLQDNPTEALVYCTHSDDFKCGFASADGCIEVDFGPGAPRYTRRSATDMSQPYAHGLPLEVFNAPVLNYFEVETHSPLRTLGAGEVLRFAVVETLGV